MQRTLVYGRAAIPLLLLKHLLVACLFYRKIVTIIETQLSPQDIFLSQVVFCLSPMSFV